jgi:membrane-associated phospholipid phosphatase
MNNNQTKDFYDTLAKIVSVIFHPLLMPVYGLTIIFSAPTLFGYLPFEVKKILLLVILINNVFLPLSLMPLLYNRKIISTWTIDDRKERRIPLMLTTILYGTTCYIIFRFPIPFFLKSFIFSSFFISLLLTVINFWWKISLHAAGAGALLAIVLFLSVKMNAPLEWYLIGAIIEGSLVMSSRLKLNYHNPQQVWVGFLAGFLGLIIFMMLF